MAFQIFRKMNIFSKFCTSKTSASFERLGFNPDCFQWLALAHKYAKKRQTRNRLKNQGARKKKENIFQFLLGCGWISWPPEHFIYFMKISRANHSNLQNESVQFFVSVHYGIDVKDLVMLSRNIKCSAAKTLEFYGWKFVEMKIFALWKKISKRPCNYDGVEQSMSTSNKSLDIA